MSAPIILYRYDASPFSAKVNYVLLLKGLPHSIVNVSPTLPRPEITEGLGLSYRRIPVLAIGNDVYCDTSLITSVLERRFSDSQYSLFPPRKNNGTPDTGLLHALSTHYVEQVLFPLATVFLPWDRFPQSFLKDRETLRGAPINTEATLSSREHVLSTLSAHLTLVEEQLNGEREWLFDTENPGLVDISLAFLLLWVKPMRSAAPLFDVEAFPQTLRWLERFRVFMAHLKTKTAQPSILTGEEAARVVASAPFESYSIVGFDMLEASRLGINLGDIVAVAPNDTGKAFPTVGKVIALNKREVTLETNGAFGLIRCHFPRIGFTCKRFVNNKL